MGCRKNILVAGALARDSGPLGEETTELPGESEDSQCPPVVPPGVEPGIRTFEIDS